MKKLACIFSCMFIMTLMLIAASAEIQSGYCGANGGNLTCEFDPDLGTLSISGEGAMKDYALSVTPWEDYRADVKTIVLGENVTSIGDYAFSGCSALENVVIPQSVSDIGFAAFDGCTDFVIGGYRNSYARDYAGISGIAFARLDPAVPGDADSNGEVTITDAGRTLQHIIGFGEAIDTDAADTDASGTIGIYDVARILQYLAGWDVSLGDGGAGNIKIPEPPAGHSNELYSVSIHTESGIETSQYKHGTLISTILAPDAEDGKAFVGYFHDEEFTDLVESTETVTGNIDIYAMYADVSSEPDAGRPNYIAKIDVEPSFSVKIKHMDGSALESVTLGVIKDGEPFPLDSDVVLRNISNSMLTDGITEENALVADESLVFAEGVLTLDSGLGFKEGYTYQIEIINEDIIFDELQMNGRPADEYIDYFNFSVAQEEVLLLELSNELKYIPSLSLSESDRDDVLQYGGLFTVQMMENGETVYTPNDGEGSFTYTGDDIAVGDTVAVYEGEKPSDRGLESTDDSVAYLKVTRIEDDTVYYKCAEAEDVIFTPDIIPIDLDGEDCGVVEYGDGRLVIRTAMLNFSDEKYALVGLNALTTIDKGDYVGFFAGELGNATAITNGYGLITEVSRDGENTVILYTDVSEEEVLFSMSTYSERELSEEELEEIIDESAFEQQLIEQFMTAEVLTEVIMQTSSSALASDEMFETFGEDINPDDFVVTFSDGTTIDEVLESMADGNIVSEKLGKVKFNVFLTPILQHFKNHSGIRAEISFSCEYTIKPKKSSSIDGSLKLSVCAFFEEELHFGISFKGEAIWKKAWIFPYIADYHYEGTYGVGLYAGIGLVATAKTKSNEGGTIEQAIEALDFSDAERSVLDKSLEGLVLALKGTKDVFEKALKDKSNGTASQGLAKKYAKVMKNASEAWIELFRADLFEMSGCFDPYHIIAYEIDVDLVVSATIYAELGVSFSAELLKEIGFEGRLFEKKAAASTTDMNEKYGFRGDAYLIGTIGIRAGVSIKMTVGLFSTWLDGVGLQPEIGIYAQIWGFAYAFLQNYVNDAGNWEFDWGFSGAFLLEIGAYLDVKFVAELAGGALSWTPTILSYQWPFFHVGEREFVMDFAYDESDERLTQTMIGDSPLTLPSNVFEMKYMDLTSGELYGDEKDALGRWKTSDVDGNYGTVLSPKNFDSSKFRGVDSDDEMYFTVIMSNPCFKYDPVTNKITVDAGENSVYQEGEMHLVWSKNHGISFTTDHVERVVKLEWSDPENTRFFQFNSMGGSKADPCIGAAGEPITWPADPTKTGYVFGGWYSDEACTSLYTARPSVLPENFGRKPNGDIIKGVTLYAKWIPDKNSVKVEYYLQELNTTYSLYEHEILTELGGEDIYTDDAIVKSEYAKDFEGFTYYDRMSEASSSTVSPDGSTVIKLYYKRNKYKLTFDIGHSEGINPVTVHYYGADIYAATVVRSGYEFAGWEGLPEAEENGRMTMPAHDVTAHAIWTPASNTPYYSAHYLEEIGGGYVLHESFMFEGATDASVTPDVLNYEGFISPSPKTSVIRADGETVVVYQYDRARYTLTWLAHENLYRNITTKFGATIAPPEGFNPTNAGYTFDGWDYTEGTTMPAHDFTVHAKWNANDYTITLNPAGGESNVTTFTAPYGSPVPTPPSPTRNGYNFVGWFVGNDEYVFTTMPLGGITVTAKWEPKSGIGYTVEHYKENLDGSFTLADVQECTGTVGHTVSAQVRDYIGFVLDENNVNAKPSGTVSVDENENGNLILALYYKRGTYTISFVAEGATAPLPITALYGESISAPTSPAREGYLFTYWTRENSSVYSFEENSTMPGESITLYARFIERTDMPYTVNHYREKLTGGYELYGSEELSNGVTGEAVIAAPNVYTGFVYNERKSTSSVTIVPGSEAVLDLYYDREEYTVSFVDEDGEELYPSVTVLYGGTAYEPDAPERMGYNFIGWTLDNAVYSFDGAVVGDITLVGHFAARNDISYTVEYYLEKLTGGYDLCDTAVYNDGVTEKPITVSPKVYTGYIYNEEKSEASDEEINADGSTVLKLYYDRDDYTVSFVDEDGEELYPSLTVLYGEAVSEPDEPARTGYDFSGWKLDDAVYHFDSVVVEDITLVAVFTARNDIPYTVNHYVQNISGEYELFYSETLENGTTDSEITVSPKSYTGFEYNKSKSNNTAVISADGFTALELYYDRLEFTVIFDHNDESGEVTEITALYGADISVPALERAGYTFGGWMKGDMPYTIGGTMPAENITLTAVWVANDHTPYTVECYLADENGEYNEATYTYTLYGETDASVRIDENVYEYEYFTFDAAADNVMSGDIEGDGTLTLKLYYVRDEFTVTFDFNNESGDTEELTLAHGAPITAPEVEYVGYSFGGWYLDDAIFSDFTMPTSDITLVAKWSARNDIPYTVNHYVQNLSGGYDLDESKVLSDTTKATVAVSPKVYTGFVYNEEKSTSSDTINGDGSTLLELYYDRIEYTVSFVDKDGAEVYPSVTVLYGDTVDVPGTPVREGYNFICWMCNGEAYDFGSEVADNITIVAKFTVRTDIPYTVEHYKQQLDGTYTLADTAYYNDGIMEGSISVALKTKIYEGFNYASSSDNKISSPEGIVLKIYYDRKIYTVRYNNNGQILEAVTVMYGDTLDREIVPDKAGYTFDGWTLDGELYDFDSPVTSSFTLFAKYSARTDIPYKILHYFQHPNNPNMYGVREEEYKEGTTDTIVIAAPKQLDGYTYNEEFSVTSGTVKADGSLVLKLYYNCNTITVTFDYNGADHEEVTETHRCGQKFTLPTPEVTRPGYTFGGWEYDGALYTSEFTVPNSDITMKARWNPRTDIEYRIEYYLQNADGSYPSNCSYYDSYPVVMGAVIKSADLPLTPPPEGYTMSFVLNGIFPVPSIQPAQGTVTVDENGNGNLVFKVKYSRLPYDLVINDPDGTEIYSKSYRYGAELSESEIKSQLSFDPTSYSYNGYYIEGLTDTMPIGGLTATVKLDDPIKYNIKYFLDDKYFAGSKPTYYTVESGTVILPRNVNMPNYDFVDWKEANSAGTVTGGVVKTISAGSKGDRYFVPVFTPKTYKITYDYQGGNNPGNPISYTVETATFTLKTPKRNGYTFKNWTVYTNGNTYTSESVTINKGTSGDIKLTANWTGNMYMVDYNLGSGGLLQTSLGYGTYEGHNAAIVWDPNEQTYFFENDSTSDPYVTLPYTAHLVAGKTYYVKLFSSNAQKANSVQLFYAINGEFNEDQSVRFGGTVTIQTINVSVTGEYKIRIDNDTGDNIWIDELCVTEADIRPVESDVYGTVYDKLPTPTRKYYVFDGWYYGDKKVTSTTELLYAGYHALTAKWVQERADYTYLDDTLNMRNMMGSSGKYMLLSDITLSGGWSTISSFSGILDGNGFSISNMKIESGVAYSDDYAMFYQIEESGVVRNLTFRDCIVKWTSDSRTFSGAIYVNGSILTRTNYGEISNCNFISNDVILDTYSAPRHQFLKGGVIAYENYGTVSNCKSEGNYVKVDADTQHDDYMDTKSNALAMAAGLIVVNRDTGKVKNCSSKNNTIEARIVYIKGSSGCTVLASPTVITNNASSSALSSVTESGCTVKKTQREYRKNFWGNPTYTDK